MILSEQKPFEEILGFLGAEKSVFILGCNGCAQSSGSGGPAQVEEMKNKLTAAVTSALPFACAVFDIDACERNTVESVNMAIVNY